MQDGARLVRSEHHDSLETSDPHALLFGPDDHQYGDDGYAAAEPVPGYPPGPMSREQSRRSRQHQRRLQRRRRRRASLAAVVAAIIVVAGGWYIARPLISDRFSPKDWAGPGTGQVLVQVKANDTAGAIGSTLVKQGVVRTKRAFTNAASKNDESRSIEPGYYRLHKHMQASLALAMLLDPSSKVSSEVTIPEGTTEKDVLVKLSKVLRVPVSAMQSAAAKVGDLGLPEGYSAASGALKSAEGFFFPDTYGIDPGTTPADALQQMTSEFTSVDRDMGFAEAAHKLKITPYQALIIASMIEGEAKFSDDRPKVARVVFNRLAKNMPLGIDATSSYEARLAGKDPAKIDYNVPTPYNTRLTAGLPPTPIGNPGRAAMTAAVQPTPGNWLYYVNGDAEGHLYFTNDENAFATAVEKCRQNHWGCG
jgi:UPF0755 protein